MPRPIHTGQVAPQPQSFGEPTRHYAAAQLDLRRGAVWPLVVYYGVHHTQPQVFIREFRDLFTTVLRAFDRRDRARRPRTAPAAIAIP